MPKATGSTEVVLVGRTNVGKSTIFNRLVGQPRALVSAEAGTTRDRNRAAVTWQGVRFWLTDTGGLDPATADPAAQATKEQVERALHAAHVVLFVVDGAVGLTPGEREFAKHLHRLKKPTLLVVNKIDGPKRRQESAIPSLGFSAVVLISGLSGSGLGDLLDLTVAHLTHNQGSEPQLRVGLLGKTNVGKSSLFNRLLGQERSIVLATPHTTRDAVRDYLQHEGLTLELIDTAGLRRQLVRASKLEQQSVEQSLDMLEHIDVAILVIDASQPPTWQDQRLGDLIVGAGVGALVLLNKADLVPEVERPGIEQSLKRWLPMLAWAQLIWVSAVSGSGLKRIIPETKLIAKAWHFTLEPAELTTFTAYLKRAKTTRTLPLGEFLQTGTQPPSFVLQLKTKENIPVAIGGWIERELRQRYKIKGTPVRVRLQGLRKK